MSPVASPSGRNSASFPKSFAKRVKQRGRDGLRGETGGENRRAYERGVTAAPRLHHRWEEKKSLVRAGQGTRHPPVYSASNPDIFLWILGDVPRGVPRGGSLWITPGIPTGLTGCPNGG